MVKADIPCRAEIASGNSQGVSAGIEHVQLANAWRHLHPPSAAPTAGVESNGIFRQFRPREEAEVLIEELPALGRFEFCVTLFECRPLVTEA